MKKLIFIIVFLLLASPTYAGLITIVDQQNPDPYETTYGSSTISFGQSFTPTLSAVDAFEFLLGGSDATIIVNLRQGIVGYDGLGGSIIAQSVPVLVNQYGSNLFHFDFTERIYLTPCDLYVAELKILSGDLGVRGTQNNLYGNGQFLHGGLLPSSFNNTDLVFSEGLTSPTPIPATIFLFLTGLIGLGGLRISRKKS